MSNEFGKGLRDFRDKNRITQTELSAITGYTRQSIANWETGRTLPKISVIYEIGKMLDIKFDLDTVALDSAALSKNQDRYCGIQSENKLSFNFYDFKKRNMDAIDISSLLEKYEELKSDNYSFVYQGTIIDPKAMNSLMEFIKFFLQKEI